MALPTSKILRRIVSEGSTPVGINSMSLEEFRIAESTTAIPPAVFEVPRATENSTDYTQSGSRASSVRVSLISFLGKSSIR